MTQQERKEFLRYAIIAGLVGNVCANLVSYLIFSQLDVPDSAKKIGQASAFAVNAAGAGLIGYGLFKYCERNLVAPLPIAKSSPLTKKPGY